MRSAAVVCVLVGCSYNPSPASIGDDACSTGCDAATPRLLPSNLDSLEDLDGATDGLIVSGTWLISTADGSIVAGSVPIRTAGEGIQNGTSFRILDATTAVLGVDALSIPVGTTLRVSGPRGLIILSRADIVIAGVLDVAASGPRPGPGAGNGGVAGIAADGCGAGVFGTGDTNFREESGGGGGGFGTPGAAGGQTDDGLNIEPPGLGGGSCGTETLVPLVAGSGGGHGGEGDDSNGGGGDGGGGGGAIQLSALGELRVEAGGVIDASGGGGGATLDDDAGGGGGGSGGAILLEAANVTVAVDGIVVANGGGGGCGNVPRAGAAGAGAPGTRSRGAARGGETALSGDDGNGGSGGSRDSMVAKGKDAVDGGGGGGGAVGRIRINRTVDTLDELLVSPGPSFGEARYE